MLVFEIAFLVVAALMLAVDIIFLLSTLFSGPWKSEALRKFDDAMNGIAPEGEKHKKKGLFGKLEK